MKGLRRISVLLFFFLISGTVSTAFPAAEKPSLWVHMQEKVIWILGTTDISEQTGQAESTLIEELATLGYNVVDAAAVRRNISQAQGLRTLEGDEKAAAAMGLRYGAQYSVVGNAMVKSGAAGIQGSNLKTVHATVNARVIRNADARIIASASIHVNVAHLDEVAGASLAIEQASRKLARKLDTKIRSLVTKEQAVGPSMVLNISGLKSYRHLNAIMLTLGRSTPGVENVRLEDFTSGTATILITYRGGLRELADDLVHEHFRDFRLEPTHVTSNRIDLRSVLDKAE